MLLYSDNTICLILYLYLLVLAILAIFTCILNNLLDKIVDKSCNQLYTFIIKQYNVIFVWYLLLNLQIRNGENSMINNLSTNINQNLKIKSKLKFTLNI